MKVPRLATLVAAVGLFTVSAETAEDSDFLIKSAGDLADLCGTASDDGRRVAAIHMCEGYIVGAHHFHTAVTTNTGSNKIYCLPKNGMPSRDEVASEFVTWVRKSPQAADLPAIEGFMRWAAGRFPCSRE